GGGGGGGGAAWRPPSDPPTTAARMLPGGQGLPNVATLSTEHSKRTRRSLREGSRSPYGGGCFVYLVQILSTWVVTRFPSCGSSSETSRLTVHLMLSQG